MVFGALVQILNSKYIVCMASRRTFRADEQSLHSGLEIWKYEDL